MQTYQNLTSCKVPTFYIMKIYLKLVGSLFTCLVNFKQYCRAFKVLDCAILYVTDLPVELRHLVHCLVGGLCRTDQVEHGRQPLGPGDVPRGTLRCPRRLVHLAGYCCILHPPATLSTSILLTLHNDSPLSIILYCYLQQ